MRLTDQPRREFLQRCVAAGVAAAGLMQGCGGEPAGPIVPPKTAGGEGRAVWLGLNSPRDLFCDDGQANGLPTVSGVQRVVGMVAASGFNTLFLQADSWYAYSLLHPDYRPQNPLAAFDAIAEILRACERAGLQVHLNYPLVNCRNNPRLPGIAPDFLAECGGDPRWRARYVDANGGIVESQDNACPSRMETRTWQVDLLERMLDRYPEIVHFQFEEPGYDTAWFCVCDECCRQYAERYGDDLIEQVRQEGAGGECPEPDCLDMAAALKCEHLTTLLRQVRARFARRPLVYSATVSPDRWLDRRRGRDWVRWSDAGWLDFVAPMVYVFDTDSFRGALEHGVLGPLASRVSACAGIGLHFGGSLVPAPGQRSPDVNPVEEVVRQIECAREVARRTGRVDGFALFLGEHLRPAYRQEGARLLAQIGAAALDSPADPPLWGSPRQRYAPPLDR
jgi:hypothetical protein